MGLKRGRQPSRTMGLERSRQANQQLAATMGLALSHLQSHLLSRLRNPRQSLPLSRRLVRTMNPKHGPQPGRPLAACTATLNLGMHPSPMRQRPHRYCRLRRAPLVDDAEPQPVRCGRFLGPALDALTVISCRKSCRFHLWAAVEGAYPKRMLHPLSCSPPAYFPPLKGRSLIISQDFHEGADVTL